MRDFPRKLRVQAAEAGKLSMYGDREMLLQAAEEIERMQGEIDHYWLHLTLIKNNGSDDHKYLKEFAKDALEYP